MSRQEILTLGASGNRFCSLSHAAILFPRGNGVAAMKDLQAQLENLRADAAECALIRDLATDPKKRELFTRLADHLTVLASEVEHAIADSAKHT
jgi:hypothetical protein